jgi:hypothetical protein
MAIHRIIVMLMAISKKKKTMKPHKESILSQIKIVNDNVRRLKTLVEADLHDIPDTKVSEYCCMKAILQLQNIAKGISSDKNNEIGM